MSDEVTVLDIAVVKRNTLYAAIKDNETQEVYCAVYLLRWSRDYYNFSYKPMTEYVGPCESECPERILKLLTPLNDQNDPNNFAREWRKRCEENIINCQKLNTGNFIIKSKEPLSFTNGSSYQYFKRINRKMYAGIVENNIFNSYLRVGLNLKHIQYELQACN
jgi:hypothetical protein